MHEDHRGMENRRVRVFTAHGHVDGTVRVSSRLSTLNYMNVTARSRSFMVMSPPIEPSSGWNVVEGTLALAFASVLFVQELRDFDIVDSDREAAALYERCAVRLSVGEYAIEGYLHLPPGGDPITRLNQDSHEFFALSSVSAMGPQAQFATHFLAVKRSEVIALQAIGSGASLEDVAESEVPVTW